ncbi:MAG: hypothetical protein RDV48_11010 [Candidatus Eremiobacteraeota bacterium]|nr:hypothetical protein [Candidatus Eremiobacteraeota bacterium]
MEPKEPMQDQPGGSESPGDSPVAPAAPETPAAKEVPAAPKATADPSAAIKDHRAIDAYEALARKRKKKSLMLAIAGFAIVVIGTVILFTLSQSLQDRLMYHYDFDKSVSGWVPMGSPLGTVTRVPGPPRDGKASGCLCYAYRATPGGFTGIVRFVPTLKYLSKIEFWCYSEHEAELTVGLEEDDGSSYLYVFSLKPGEWKQISALPESFVLNRSSKDENGMLDIDQLSPKVLFADVSGLKGMQFESRFYLDDLVITRRKDNAPRSL